MENSKINFLNELKYIEDDIIYFESFLGYLISPVITGIKPSSIINLKNNNRKSYNSWNKLGSTIIDRYKLKSVILKEEKGNILLLIYDEENLKDHINIRHNRNFLCSQGYGESLELHRCIECLKNKMTDEEFPHESGIFMGIPLEDVLGFLEEGNCIFKGPWKVYEKEERSKEVFDLYEQSKELFIENRKNPIYIKDKFKKSRQKLYLIS